MQRLVLLCLFILSCHILNAQNLKRDYAHLQPQFLNPAAVGTQTAIEARLIHRKQWWGLQGSPEGSVLSLSAPGSLLRNDSVRTASGGESRHGYGLILETNAAGLLRSTSAAFQYAHHLWLNDEVKMSAGLSAGFRNDKFNTADAIVLDQNDKALEGTQQGFAFDISVGLWLEGENAFGGFSILNISEAPIRIGATEETQKRLYCLNYGMNFSAGKGGRFDVQPSAWLISDGKSTHLRAGLHIFYQDKLFGGVQWRIEEAIALQAGYALSSNLRLSYAFEPGNISRQSTEVFSSHELMLSLRLREAGNSLRSRGRVRAF